MEKKEGEHVCNARVDVDYSKGKPEIDFSYPGKNPNKDARKQGGYFGFIIIIWLIIGVLPFYISYGGDIVNQAYPKDCGNLSFNDLKYNKEIKYTGDLNYSFNISLSKVYGFDLTCDNKTHIFEYSPIEGYFYIKNSRDYDYILWGSWLYISTVVSFILNKLLTIWLIKQKWYQKWLPKVNAEGFLLKTRKKKYYKYESDDVLENVIVIPRFSNVELDYKTTGEFSKYLKNIKIREYKKRKIDVKTNKISKEKVEHFKWYVVFYFKKKPKNGYLEVIYQ